MKLYEANNILSNKICRLCFNDLNVFEKFRKDLIGKQKKLYRLFLEIKPKTAKKILDHDIKSERNEFVDCSVPVDLESEIEIKSEIEETEYEFSSLKKLKETEFDDELEFICDTCGFLCETKQELENHIKLHMKKGQQSFFCEFCSKEFGKV